MKTILIFCCCLFSVATFGQPGITEMQEAGHSLSNSFFSTIDLAFVLAILFGLLGGLRIYHNWQMGEQRMDSAVAAWFFAAIFMVLAAPFIKALFGI